MSHGRRDAEQAVQDAEINPASAWCDFAKNLSGQRSEIDSGLLLRRRDLFQDRYARTCGIGEPPDKTQQKINNLQKNKMSSLISGSKKIIPASRPPYHTRKFSLDMLRSPLYVAHIILKTLVVQESRLTTLNTGRLCEDMRDMPAQIASTREFLLRFPIPNNAFTLRLHFKHTPPAGRNLDIKPVLPNLKGLLMI